MKYGFRHNKTDKLLMEEGKMVTFKEQKGAEMFVAMAPNYHIDKIYTQEELRKKA